jgi:SAM-dependent methyltransferase
MTLSLVTADSTGLFYARLVGRQPGRVLILGAADGRVAVNLAERGHDVLGVEPSLRLLEAARARAAQSQPEGTLSWVHADVRSFRSPARFSAVLAPQNALGLMSTHDELDAMLDAAGRHLVESGIFAFDLTLPALPPVEAAPGRFVHGAHLRERGAVGKAVRRFRRPQYTSAELELALAGVGLTLRERYGDFKGSPWDEGQPLQVCVAGR